MTRRRYTVPEAAEALGVSVEAIRGRIKRYSLKSERENNRTYVLLEDSDLSQPVNDRASDRTELVEELRDRLRFMEEQLAAERDAHREARRIIGGLVQRIPELPAPQDVPPDAPGQPEKASTDAGKVDVPDDREKSAERRSLWQRIFGGT